MAPKDKATRKKPAKKEEDDPFLSLKRDRSDESDAELNAADEKEEKEEARAKKLSRHGIRWEVDETAPLVFYKGHKAAPTCIDAHPKDMAQGLYSGATDCCIISWDAETGKKKCIMGGLRNSINTEGHTDTVTGVVGLWSDGLLVSSSKDGRIMVWDPREGSEPVHTVVKSTNEFTCMSLVPPSPEEVESPEEWIKKVIVGTAKGDLESWMIAMGEGAEEGEDRRRLFNYYKGHTETITDIAMTSGNYDRIVSGSSDRTTRYHALAKESYRLFDRHQSPVNAVAQLVNQVVASGDDNGELLVWSTGARKPVAAKENLFQSNIAETRPIHSLYAPHGGSHTVFAGGALGRFSVIQVGDLVSSGRKADLKVTQEFRIDSHNKTLAPEGSEGVGAINAFAASLNEEGKQGRLAMACGRNSRLGRWYVESGAKDGIAIVALQPL